MERLQKLLAQSGVASRRAAEELIRAGRVTVDGKVARIGDSADPSSDIRVGGKPLAAPAGKVTYLLYKPRGIVSSAHDELGRENVLEHMPRVPGLHNVGRLDLDSEGLLLLTNDGQLTLELTHPRYALEKEYRVYTRRPLDDAEIRALERGIPLEDGLTLPAKVTAARDGLFITLKEGRNRQIRRMLEHLGHQTRRLVRVRMGGLYLGDLESGEYRTLSTQDLLDLRHPERRRGRDLERERAQMLELWS